MTNPYAPPEAFVVDIDDPAATVVPADRSTRLGAALLDGLIGGALVYGPMILGAVIGSASGSSAAVPLAVAGASAGLVVWIWFTVKYVRRSGQSIAKRMLSIKVVRRDGSPASLGRIFWMRNVLNGLLSFIPFYGFVELLFIFGEARQCLHDKLADTIVVRA